MFGKTRDINDTDTLDSSAIDEFFGDEAAAATQRRDPRPARPRRAGRVADQQPVHVARHVRPDRPGAGRARPSRGQGRDRALRATCHLADRARACRPHHLVHRHRPRRLAGHHRPPRRARALRRPHPAGPRREPPATEGPRPGDQRHVRHPHRLGRTGRRRPAGTTVRRPLPPLLAAARRTGDHRGRRPDQRPRLRPLIDSNRSISAADARARGRRQRTISMRMPVSSQNGSTGMRLIARPDARRAVNSSAPACSMCTAPAPSGGVRVDDVVDAGQALADQLEPFEAAVLVVRRGLQRLRRCSSP